MKTEKRMNLLLMLVIIVLFWTSPLFSEILRGKLERLGPHGISPAPYILVALKSSLTGRQFQPQHTETNGMYFFNDVTAGGYILKIWPQGYTTEPLQFDVQVREQKTTDIEPILIHSFKFEEPKKGRVFKKGDCIDADGSHNFPDYASVWITVEDEAAIFWLHPSAVELDKDGTWECDNIQLPTGAVRLYALLASEADHQRFRQQTIKQAPTVFKKLPPACRIIASRRLTVK